MIKYIVSAVIITLFLLADIYIFAVCGEVIGFAMVALEAVAVVRLKYRYIVMYFYTPTEMRFRNAQKIFLKFVK